MKIVLDTNVLISGFLTVTGMSQYVLSIALRRHTVYLSEFILEEFKRNLVEKLKIPEGQVRKAIQLLKKRSVILKITVNPKIEFSDKQDIPILSLVEVVKPHYFISGDKELRSIKKMGSTVFLSPREAVEIL